jgi:sulfur carrier protein ThiS adenylyltransferase
MGESAQIKLKNATVLIAGIGGLGNPAALYLAAAGVGKLILADGDNIELSNLQRQIIFTENDIDLNKAEQARTRLNELNSEIDIEVIDEMLDRSLLEYYLPEVDLVLDCTDNLTARYLLNQLCIEQQKPLIIGAAIRFEGQILVVNSQEPTSCCYQCLYPKSDEDLEVQLNCQTAGIVGPVLGIVGSMQALEAIKLLTGKPMKYNQLRLFDGLSGHWQNLNIAKQKNCICNFID